MPRISAEDASVFLSRKGVTRSVHCHSPAAPFNSNVSGYWPQRHRATEKSWARISRCSPAATKRISPRRRGGSVPRNVRKAGPCVSEVEPIPLRDAPGKTRRIQTAKDFLALTERDRTLVRAALLLAQAISLSNGVCDAFVDAGPDLAVA